MLASLDPPVSCPCISDHDGDLALRAALLGGDLLGAELYAHLGARGGGAAVLVAIGSGRRPVLVRPPPFGIVAPVLEARLEVLLAPTLWSVAGWLAYNSTHSEGLNKVKYDWGTHLPARPPLRPPAFLPDEPSGFATAPPPVLVGWRLVSSIAPGPVAEGAVLRWVQKA